MEFTSEIKVDLVQSIGSDSMIAAAARVSTGMDMWDYEESKDFGLIKYLMQNRHGSPFEHGQVTVRVEVPIFVAREWMRHRMQSYNEVSGRYKKLEPKFYIYPEDRPLVQEGSGAHPRLGSPGGHLLKAVNANIVSTATKAWREYESMVGDGDGAVANEVARVILPVGIYTSFYATLNPRALMSFLSLRVDHPDNSFTTKPLWEIQKAAEQLEDIFKEAFPMTHTNWVMAGRVAP